MQVRINGIFQSAEIFGGTLDFTTRCSLAVSEPYSLISAQLGKLDILKALNEAFDLGLGDISLTVESAGFFTFSAGAGGSPEATLAGIFPDSPVSAADLGPLAAGTTGFWFTLALGGPDGDAGLFASMMDIGVASGTRLSLLGRLEGANGGDAIRNADYTGTLTGWVDLFGIFKVSDLVVSYRMDSATQLSIAATIDLLLFDCALSFSGSIISDSEARAVTAELTAAGSAGLASLFGGAMPNISFNDVAFNLYYPYGTSSASAQFMLRGSCAFGGLQFTGLLYMEKASPVLASVVFTESLSISKLFDQCIPHGSWPGNLVDLTLEEGSQAYYNASGATLTLTLANDGTGPTFLPVARDPLPASPSSPADPTQVKYEPGFNLLAAFELELLDAFSVDGNVVVGNDGVTASIEIEHPINLYVLQIARQGDPTLGPLFTISTSGGTGTMGFAAALLFFGEDFGADVTIDASRADDGSLLIEGTLSPTQDYSPLLSASDRLGFSYGKADGFQITDWPDFAWGEQIIDFCKALQNLVAEGSGGCGEIADFVNQQLLTQSWTFTPNFSPADDQGGALSLSIDVVYSLSFAQKPFATFTLKRALEFTLSSNVSLASLWPLILNGIKNAPEKFVQALLQDPNAIASFLLVAAGNQATSYAATLVCEGLVDAIVDAVVLDAGSDVAGAIAAGAVAGLVAAAIEKAGGASQQGNAGHGPSPTLDAPANLTATATPPDIEVAWWPSSGAQTYRVSLALPDGTQHDSGPLAYDCRTFEFEDVLASPVLPGAITVSIAASKPATPPATATTILCFPASRATFTPGPDVAVEISWQGPAGVDYEVTVSDGRPSLKTPSPSVILDFAGSDQALEYVVTIAALDSAGPVPGIAFVPLTLTRLAAPAGLAGAATAGALQLSWQTVPGAASYALAWSDPSGHSGGQLVAAGAAPVQTGSIALPDMAAGGIWTISVQAMPPEAAATLLAGVPSALQIAVAKKVPGPTWLQTPDRLALSCYGQSLDGATCGRELVQAFPDLVPATLAVAMAHGGYAAAATGSGLHAAFPTITPGEMAESLVEAYPPAPQTPAQLAQSWLARNADGASCGVQLIHAFPALDAAAMARAMALGGYNAEATGDGLHAAFPSITPEQMAAALVGAYE